MTSQTPCPRDLSDCDLLAALKRATASERQATAELIALLMEVDTRKLYAGQGCSSLFTYCVQVLHFSEHAAYLRIEAERCARRFPGVLDKLADGSLHLTAISLLSPHLTAENVRRVLDAATHKSKRDVEQIVVRLRPQPDVASVVRKLPAPARVPVPSSEFPVPVPDSMLPVPVADTTPPAITAPAAPRPPEIKPLAPERYKVQCTVSRETYDKLRRVQDLLRHTVPTGDVSVILDRALTLLLADLSRTRFAATDRPQRDRPSRPHSRHIPAGVKRNVWTRDGGRCAFQGEQGRCAETGFLEFHHVVPYAEGGETSVSNVQLRCRTHNQYEADQWFGVRPVPHARETRPDFWARE